MKLVRASRRWVLGVPALVAASVALAARPAAAAPKKSVECVADLLGAS